MITQIAPVWKVIPSDLSYLPAGNCAAQSLRKNCRGGRTPCFQKLYELRPTGMIPILKGRDCRVLFDTSPKRCVSQGDEACTAITAAYYSYGIQLLCSGIQGVQLGGDGVGNRASCSEGYGFVPSSPLERSVVVHSSLHTYAYTVKISGFFFRHGATSS